MSAEDIRMRRNISFWGGIGIAKSWVSIIRSVQLLASLYEMSTKDTSIVFLCFNKMKPGSQI